MAQMHLTAPVEMQAPQVRMHRTAPLEMEAPQVRTHRTAPRKVGSRSLRIAHQRHVPLLRWHRHRYLMPFRHQFVDASLPFLQHRHHLL